MPKDFSLDKTAPDAMRRSEYAKEEAWIVEFLSHVDTGYVATRWDEQPFITPVNFWYDPKVHQIFFHTSPVGRVQANIQRHPQVCFTASKAGKFLPSNVALEFGVQYESVVAFGNIRILEDPQAQKSALYGLIKKHFPAMVPGEHYRPITEGELKRTAVFAIAIDRWSGKRNWNAQAEQSPDWPPLGNEWLE